MSVKRIKETDIPKRERKSKSRFESTLEWRKMRAEIDAGLKTNEAVQCTLTPEKMREYGLTPSVGGRRNLMRFVQKYLTAHKLDYGVRSFHRDGMHFIVVQYTPVERQTA